eukprot:c16274_g1_i1 orf=578-988(+)
MQLVEGLRRIYTAKGRTYCHPRGCYCTLQSMPFLYSVVKKACVEHIRTCYNICDIYVPVPLPKKRAFAHSEFIMIEGNLYYCPLPRNIQEASKSIQEGPRNCLGVPKCLPIGEGLLSTSHGVQKGNIHNCYRDNFL